MKANTWVLYFSGIGAISVMGLSISHLLKQHWSFIKIFINDGRPSSPGKYAKLHMQEYRYSIFSFFFSKSPGKARWSIGKAAVTLIDCWFWIQGRSALEKHFRNSRLACDTNEFLPMAFDPPRNGNNVTDTIVITGLNVCNNSIQQEDGNVGAAESKSHDVQPA